jgi:hypothetical protein
MVHTMLHAVVHHVEFLDEHRVLVTATIGESESNTEKVQFHMTLEQALAADIIERV